MFSSNGEMRYGDEIRFARTLPDGDVVVVTAGELRWLKPDGAVRWQAVLPYEPSGAPLLSRGGDVWIPTLEGTLLRATPESGARPVARHRRHPRERPADPGEEQEILADIGENAHRLPCCWAPR